MRAPSLLPAICGFVLLCAMPRTETVAGVGRPTAGGESTAQDTAAVETDAGDDIRPTDVLVHTVPCTSVATTWPVFDGTPPNLSAPTLSLVRTDFRPKDVRLILDGRFIGRARYFNGKKGYLYLEPGRYRLQCEAGGYRTEVFEIDARPNCRFDIRHRMARASGANVETRGDPPGKGVPMQRVFSPLDSGTTSARPLPPQGPEPDLRPDVGAARSDARSPSSNNGSLRLTVRPTTASVYINGAFLATGEEFDLMVGPLSIAAGSHILEVQAPGFVPQIITVAIAEGETKEYEFYLEKSTER